MGFVFSCRFGGVDIVELIYQGQGIVTIFGVGVLTNECLVKSLIVIVAVVIDADGKIVISEELYL